MAKRQTKPWTIEEQEIVRKNYIELGWKKIAHMLHRTGASVKAQACALGVTQRTNSYIPNNFSGWKKIPSATGKTYIKGNVLRHVSQ